MGVLLADLMGGTVSLRDRSDGRPGAVFRFTIRSGERGSVDRNTMTTPVALVASPPPRVVTAPVPLAAAAAAAGAAALTSASPTTSPTAVTVAHAAALSQAPSITSPVNWAAHRSVLLSFESVVGGASTTSTPAARPAGWVPTVFVVEDERVNRKVILGMLSALGVTQTVVCADGDQVRSAHVAQ